MTLPVDIAGYAVSAHAHYIGKVKATATLPDGTVTPLLWIKDWNFAGKTAHIQGARVALQRHADRRANRLRQLDGESAQSQ